MKSRSASAIEAALSSRAKLIALLLRYSMDLATAEDAVAEAFLKALETWEKEGVPDKPEAWLLTVAKNKILDQLRHRKMADSHDILAFMQTVDQKKDFPDERLKLILLCCHELIEEKDRTAIIMQIVLGLNAEEIASLFLISPKAMSQRLVRAKKYLADVGGEIMQRDFTESSPRIKYALEAVYAIFLSGWDNSLDMGNDRLTEAIYLAKLMYELAPDEPEVCGLLALVYHVIAKFPARSNALGEYIPLEDQDTELWNKGLIFEADRLLAHAAKFKEIGRFQIEAAIQSVHSRRGWAQETDWNAIATLYLALLKMAPSISATIGYSAALTRIGCLDEAFKVFESIPEGSVKSYQPYWVFKAHLAKLQNQMSACRYAYTVALGLSTNEKIRAYLQKQIETLSH